MHQGGSLLQTVEVVHWAALAFMAAVYTIRVSWLLRFKAVKDRSAPGGNGRTNAKRGAMYSLANVAMPWSMESTRTGPGFYVTFVIFHLGVAAGIGLAFVSSLYRPLLEVEPVAYGVMGVLGLAFLTALFRVARRLTSPVLRLVSTPDDYVSLFLLTGWMLLGVLAQAHIAGMLPDERFLVIFLIVTSFFLVYVPFSKISHYLYYPFTRYWLGRALGHRGSYPHS